MRRILLAAVGFAALAGGCGLASAQNEDRLSGRHDSLFQSDSNNDGVLTREEFDAGRAANFARMDANNDGQLTGEERHRMRGAGGHGHGGHRGMHSMRSADANSDGSITRDEFLARPLEHFNQIDDNHDGVISATEMPQRRQRTEGERRERVNPDANGDHQLSGAEFSAMGSSMFDRMDANDDGRVTREEAQAAGPHRRHCE